MQSRHATNSDSDSNLMPPTWPTIPLLCRDPAKRVALLSTVGPLKFRFNRHHLTAGTNANAKLTSQLGHSREAIKAAPMKPLFGMAARKFLEVAAPDSRCF